MSTRIPGPRGRFFIGSAPEFNRDTLNFLRSMRDYGDIAQFYVGPVPLVVVSHPDLAREVLVTQAAKFSKNEYTKRVLAPYIGLGLFTSEGDFWKHQRHLMQPMFHTRYIGHYAETMVAYADDLARIWQDGEVRAIDKEMSQLTMRVIGKSLFDADVNNDGAAIGELITHSLKLIEEELQAVFTLPAWVPTRFHRGTRYVAAEQNALIQGFIDTRRASQEDRLDLLSLLLNARDENGQPMPDQQVRAEALTLFNAGHETTAVTMMWTWYLLSQNPAIEGRLHEELESVLAGRLPTLGDLPRLAYTEMIVKEVLRLYPPAWGTSRDALEPVSLGGYTLPKGRAVVVNIYGMHRDPRFFPDPDKFDPERFSPDREKDIPKSAYMPFGAGPRICIGNAFAMMEARLLLATLAQRFTLSVAPGHPVVPQRQFTLRAKYGMKMVVRARRDIPVPA